MTYAVIVVAVTAVLFLIMGFFVQSTGHVGCAGRPEGGDEPRCEACPLRALSGGAAASVGACPGLPEAKE